MEDIGGCCAVVRNVGMVRRLAKIYATADKHKPLHLVDYVQTRVRPDTGGFI